VPSAEERKKGAKIETKIQSITFPFDDKAVEEGVSRLILPGTPPIEDKYTAIYVKKNGEWKILNFSELDLGLFKDKEAAPIAGIKLKISILKGNTIICDFFAG